jgi:hypothetical protein
MEVARFISQQQNDLRVESEPQIPQIVPVMKPDNKEFYCLCNRKGKYGIVLGTFGTDIFNLLKMKRNLLYIRNQSVPRCKHFPPRL